METSQTITTLGTIFVFNIMLYAGNSTCIPAKNYFQQETITSMGQMPTIHNTTDSGSTTIAGVNKDEELFNSILSFAEKITKDSFILDGEFVKFIDDNFWDLL